jgi:cation transport regulator ChaC
MRRLLIFGYGSLIGGPESPDALAEQQPATLLDHVRAFDKRSVRRGCPRDDAFGTFELPPGFESAGHLCSLAVSVAGQAGASTPGAVLVYPQAVASEALKQTDQREGFFPSEPARSGYLRKAVSVRLADGGIAEAWTYLGNPNGPFNAPDLSLRRQAEILISATPQPGTPSDGGPIERGLHYLEMIRVGLARTGRVDPGLERLAAEVLRIDGPWSAALAHGSG